jgi:hypothetical protein
MELVPDSAMLEREAVDYGQGWDEADIDKDGATSASPFRGTRAGTGQGARIISGHR